MANEKNLSLYTLEEDITTHSNSKASELATGHVKVDNDTIKIKEDGTIYSNVTPVAIQQTNTTNLPGNKSTAIGNYTSATGEDSFAAGYSTTASNMRSTVFGQSSTASGFISFTAGLNAVSSGSFSAAFNRITEANVYRSTVVGQLNRLLTGNPDVASATDDVFVVGNAFRVTNDGKTYGLSAFNSTGADYAEYFEWLDGNPNGDERVGLLVTLDGSKIRLAKDTDDYILGIISTNPAVIGDSDEDWKGKYLRDEYDRILIGDTEVEKLVVDENGECVTVNAIEQHLLINPEWDSEKSYKTREERHEWALVGLLGKVYLHDDGTCEVNSYAKPSIDGVATHSTVRTDYRVMERVNDNLIRVLVK